MGIKPHLPAILAVTRDSEACRTLYSTANVLIRCAVEWQCWLERQEERYMSANCQLKLFIIESLNPIRVGLN